jgi:hypothetical protein
MPDQGPPKSTGVMEPAWILQPGLPFRQPGLLKQPFQDSNRHGLLSAESSTRDTGFRPHPDNRDFSATFGGVPE